MLNVAVVGASGYTGVELLRLLGAHPAAGLGLVTSRSLQGRQVAEVFPGLRGLIDLEYLEPDDRMLRDFDLVFFATPHGTAMERVPALLQSGTRVIDLSADFRLQSADTWQNWYGKTHSCPQLLADAVYGLPEMHRERIKTASLVANPGCYPTAIILALLPLIRNGLIDPLDIVVDAKSGVSGAGRQSAIDLLFAEVQESFKAYAVQGHRHLPEILQQLRGGRDSDPGITFVPHLLPMVRGIHATCYVSPLGDEDLQSVMQEFYQREPFVDVLPMASCPDTASVRGSNVCRIALSQGTNGRTIVMSVIDNLVKGAAGQAIQNMNLMFGLEETMGLEAVALTP